MNSQRLFFQRLLYSGQEFNSYTDASKRGSDYVWHHHVESYRERGGSTATEEGLHHR